MIFSQRSKEKIVLLFAFDCCVLPNPILSFQEYNSGLFPPTMAMATNVGPQARDYNTGGSSFV